MTNNKKDLVGGLIFLSFGIFILLYARQYEIGTLQRIGPGFIPMILGILIASLGALTALISVGSGQMKGKMDFTELRPLFVILLSIIVFSMALRPLGLVFSLVLLISISRLAYYELRIKQLLLQIPILILIAYLVFIYGLKINLNLWPA